ncbi:MAG: hypothetical protein ACQEXJ_08835 [Myxococcota bacterium]
MARRPTPFELPSEERLGVYRSIRDHVAKGALSMIDRANHKPANRGHKPKVGGHQASCMSAVDILSALYLHCKRPQDRVAVKPHAAPVLYSLMHLVGELPREQMERLREMGGPQPYPTKLKNERFVDYTTSSEALGVCATIYDAYGAVHQNRALARAADVPAVDALYYAHCGDGELTEGQIDESLYDAGRWGLDRVVWIVDLNRQSLDRVMDDSGRLEDWAASKFRGHGWEVLPLRWGGRARDLFAREGGAALEALLDRLPDTLFHPLLMLDGAAVRQVLLGGAEHPDQGARAALEWYRRALEVGEEERRAVARALEGVSDDALADAVGHLGGHDIGALVETLGRAVAFEGRPAVVLAHTVKGYETSAAAHPENHGAILPEEEVLAWGVGRGLPEDELFPVPAAESPEARVLEERGRLLWGEPDHRHAEPPVEDHVAILAEVKAPRRKVASTGEAFQSLNLALLRTDLAPWLQFCAPDVASTTHLGPVIRQTGVFAPRDLPDAFGWLRRGGSTAMAWRPEPGGQFHALGIAEGNAMLWSYAFGRRRKRVEGKAPLLPVVTVYDKFFERGFNQLDYAVYSGARFVAVGVPSGTGLSRETATHQSLQTLRMVMDLPGILAYEPAFAADVHAVYLHALGRLWGDEGEAYYLRLTTQPLEQPAELPEDHAEQAVRGAWWLVGDDDRRPAPGAPCVRFVASGRKLAQAREAARILAEEDGVGSRILNVTSWEALWREWDAFRRDPDAWDDPSRSYHLHELFGDDEVNAPLIVTGDHVPSVADWLPAALQRVRGHRFLGPRDNGEAGDLESVDRLHGMATEDLVRAAREEIAWRRRDGVL